MSLDPQIPQPPAPQPSERRLLAPVWHTVLLVAVLLLGSISGAGGHHPLARGGSKLPQYIWGMTWEWILAGFVWLGIRKRFSLRDVIGGRWSSFDDFFLDILIAALFWTVAAVVLATGAKLMHLDQAAEARRHAPPTRISDSEHAARTRLSGFC